MHQNIKANFLMSPPLVVAFALAGRVDLDLAQGPARARTKTARTFSCGISGRRWQEIRDVMQSALTPEIFRRLYRDFADAESEVERNPLQHGRGLRVGRGEQLHPRAAVLRRLSRWTPGKIEDIRGARPLGIFGDSVTTDHISPAGAIKASSPAGQYLNRAGSSRKISTATAAAAATIWS